MGERVTKAVRDLVSMQLVRVEVGPLLRLLDGQKLTPEEHSRMCDACIDVINAYARRLERAKP